MSLKSHGKNFLAGYSGILAGISQGRPKSLRKQVCVQLLAPNEGHKNDNDEKEEEMLSCENPFRRHVSWRFLTKQLLGKNKSLPVASNHPKISQEFSEHFGPFNP